MLNHNVTAFAWLYFFAGTWSKLSRINAMSWIQWTGILWSQFCTRRLQVRELFANGIIVIFIISWSWILVRFFYALECLGQLFNPGCLTSCKVLCHNFPSNLSLFWSTHDLIGWYSTLVALKQFFYLSLILS